MLIATIGRCLPLRRLCAKPRSMLRAEAGADASALRLPTLRRVLAASLSIHVMAHTPNAE